MCLALTVSGCGADPALLDAAPGDAPASAPTTSAAPSNRATPDSPSSGHDAHASNRFVPTRLRPGQRPPQFIVVSFDGVGWDTMWQHWFAVQSQVPFRFTGFLSGTYLLSSTTKSAYHPPHYPPGTSAIGWTSPRDLPTEIDNLNTALANGDEIGTHFNGHFCTSAGYRYGASTWSTPDWDHELDQFFALVADVGTNNPERLTGVRLPALRLTVSDIHGDRTPCLEGSQRALYPALARHGFRYDASFTRSGLAWPTKTDGIWQFGMPLFPIAGTVPDGRRNVPVTAMDYNYWFIQRGATDAPTAAGSRRDSAQVLATYTSMYDAAFDGNRAPILLGNHFNDWNRRAYVRALTHFVLDVCGRPQTQCITFDDLARWMQAQSPSTLRRLQALAAEE